MARTIAEAIGSMIFSRVLDTLLKPEVPVSDVYAEKVAAQITKEVAPVVENATNSEPLHQSRVFWGSFAAFLAAVADLIAMFSTGDFDVGRASPSIAVILGTLFALYGRIRGAKLKPLGQ